MIAKELNDYLKEHIHPLSEHLGQIAKETKKKLDSAHMISGPLMSTLLRLLTQVLKPRLVLDLGTYTGFSALSIAEVLPSEAKIITCDIDPFHLEIAKENFKNHPRGSFIQVFEGKADDCIDNLKSEVDMVFLDANKNTYLEYYEALIPKIRSGGLLIMDDVLWKGMAISPVKIREKRMDAINKRIAADPRVENLLLPIRNGVNIIYKR